MSKITKTYGDMKIKFGPWPSNPFIYQNFNFGLLSDFEQRTLSFSEMQIPYLSGLDFCNYPVWIIEFDKTTSMPAVAYKI